MSTKGNKFVGNPQLIVGHIYFLEVELTRFADGFVVDGIREGKKSRMIPRFGI